MIRILCAAAAALALSACVSVLPKADPAAARYLIAPVEYSGEPGPPVEWSLTVEDPQSTRVYDNTMIALIREPGRVEFYADGEWGDRAPRLFQAALIRSFENTGRVLGVGDRIAQPVSDLTLTTDIRRMEANHAAGSPEAKFSVYARLSNSRGKVVAGRLFEASEPIKGSETSAVAHALDRAIGATLQAIVDWSLAEGEAATAKQS